MTARKKWYLLIGLLAGPVIIALIVSAGGGGGLQITDVGRLVELYRSLGTWAVLISLGLNIMQTFVVFMPSLVLSGANAVVFGLFWGTIISWAGEVIGSVLAFALYRYFGRSTVEELERSRAYLKKIDEIGTDRGFGIILVLRILPLMPSGIINLLAGLSKMSFAAFFTATALGKLPSLVVETLVGHDLFSWRENSLRLVLVLTIIAALYLVYRLVTKRGKAKNG